uniref:Uncharacterized protein n=1 Tax=Canis lupus dingo TaxID=286419 RepID=A0A8C0QWE2_CANLU
MAKNKLRGQKSRNIQKELANFSKGLSLEPLQKQLIPQQCPENEPVNVDEATRLMAQL